MSYSSGIRVFLKSNKLYCHDGDDGGDDGGGGNGSDVGDDDGGDHR
jgi:hypothetical protein